MNGTVDGTNFPNGGTNSTSYAEAHANITNSTIKTYLEGISANNYTDGWYYQNIVATGYGDYVADAIYCNDRNLYSGNGYGTITTNYSAYYGRKSGSDWTPTLICTRDDDKFTKETSLGNGKLTYPVGLITADEVVFAGGYEYVDNMSFYLYTGNAFYTMTPGSFESHAVVINISSFGYISLHVPNSDFVYGVRSVLSLKADALQYNASTSNGTREYPFIVS